MKLTKRIKDKIMAAVIKEAFEGRYNDLAAEQDAVALAAYNHIYGKHIEVMKTMPPDAFQRGSSVTVMIEGCRRYLGLKNYVAINGGSGCAQIYQGSPDEPFYFFSQDEYGKNSFNPGTKIHKRISDSFRAEELLADELKELRRELRAVLESCNTDKQLLATWPEGAKWIAACCKPDESTYLPTVTITRLNARLCGLIGLESPTCLEDAVEKEEEEQ